jgi:hypothetical protein
LEEEEELQKELQSLLVEQDGIQKQKQALQKEQEQQVELENRYWKEYNALQLRIRSELEEMDALQRWIALSSEELHRLVGWNVLSHAFSISFDGTFGTINHCRVGRRQYVSPELPQIDWVEVNAGLGYCVLLLDTLASRVFNIRFSRFTLIPRGSYSGIQELMSSETYELYGSSGWFSGQGRMNKGLAGFLSCVDDLVALAMERSPSLVRVPFRYECTIILTFMITFMITFIDMTMMECAESLTFCVFVCFVG